MRLKPLCLDILHSAYFLQTFFRGRAFVSTVSSLVSPQNHSIFILANGPSLKDDVAPYLAELSECHTLMMNHSITQNIHKDIRPKYHILLDSVYFVGDTYNIMAQSDYERVTKEVQELYHSFEQLSYPVELLVPNIWKDKIHIKNPLITLQTFGIAKFKGFDFISRFLFSKAIALPSYCNVLIPSIICCIAMGYKKIYLLGCDHDWFKGYFVDSHNKFYIDYKHFYEEQQTESNFAKITLTEMLSVDSEILRSYHTIQRIFNNISIYNLSSNSAIQAFPRSTLESTLAEIFMGGGGKSKDSILLFFAFLLHSHHSQEGTIW
ncbi:hypothetical protein [Helicobacter cinaedi]|uniref:hypothetical protein n=1 Tax=Helicobacter cinaedi TaxID=213 RepID=UPI000CF14373|nr:hypothetical protein [Helicobacter cinaedi]